MNKYFSKYVRKHVWTITSSGEVLVSFNNNTKVTLRAMYTGVNAFILLFDGDDGIRIRQRYEHMII